MIQPTMPRGVALNILKRRRDGIAVGLELIEKATDAVRCGYDRRCQTLPDAASPEACRAGARKRRAAVQPRARDWEGSMKPRNVRPVILEAMDQRTEYTAAQIHALIVKSGLTLKQVQSCVYNLQSEGLLQSSIRAGNRKAPKGGTVEKTYRLSGRTGKPRMASIQPEPTHWPRFASVFHYGQGIEATTEAI